MSKIISQHTCKDCDWSNYEQFNAREEARKHSRKTRHTTSCDVTKGYMYEDGEAKVPRDDDVEG